MQKKCDNAVMHLALLKGLVTQSAMSAFVTRAVVGAADSEEGPTPEELPQPMELGLGYRTQRSAGNPTSYDTSVRG